MAIVKMTKEAWLTKGKELFGPDMTIWEFVCPGCGHIQKVEDFRQFKDRGASPDSAYCECIGRYSGGKSWANDKASKPGPCDYAGYGLLRISPVIVIDGDKEIHCFAFNEAKVEAKFGDQGG